MLESSDSVLYKLRYVAIGVPLILISLVLLSYLITATVRAQSSGSFGDSITSESYDSPNIVTNSFAAMGDMLQEASQSMPKNAQNGFRPITSAVGDTGAFVGSAFSQAGKGIASGVVGSGRFIGHTASATVRGIGSGVGFVVSMPASTVRAVSNVDVTSTVIRPADNVDVPVITPHVSAQTAAAPAPTSSQAPAATTANTGGVQWPMHGVITTYFGEPERPYTAFHGAMDISDANAQGTTPIKPFKKGRVIAVLHYRYGYGNHVIVDHGDGITSLYAHMYKTSVSVGQEVDLNSVLGYEGRTGLATGPHVHFEIRLNGTPVNPMKYIPGRP